MIFNAAKPTTVTDKARIKSLYAGLYRTTLGWGLLIVAAWLFRRILLLFVQKDRHRLVFTIRGDRHGYSVLVVQEPETSFAADVAATRRVLDKGSAGICR